MLRARASAGASHAARSQAQGQKAGRPDEQRLRMPSSHGFLWIKPCKGHLRETNQEYNGEEGWGLGRGAPAKEGGLDGGSSEKKVFENELGLCRSFNEKTADHSDQTKFCGLFFVVVVNNTFKNCCIFILKCPGKTKSWTMVRI